MSQPTEFILQSNSAEYRGFHLTSSKPIVFGRDQGDQLFESKKISKLHCAVAVSNGVATLFVHGDNGMMVNNVRIHEFQKTVQLAIGDVIGFRKTATLSNGKELPKYKLVWPSAEALTNMQPSMERVPVELYPEILVHAPLTSMARLALCSTAWSRAVADAIRTER